MTRKFEANDGAAICSLHEQFKFPMFDLNDPTYIKEVATEDGKIVGLGAVRVTSEGIIMIDQHLPIESRSSILNELIRNGIHTCQRYGIRDMHAFLTEENASAFAKVLIKRFGFEPIVGTGLVLRF